MNILSLFDGMSCGQIALERLGIKTDNYFASEVDKYAIKVTQANYPDTIQMGDITGLSSGYLPKIDLLIGGSPCQGFSAAGKGLGFSDPRSMLFYHYVRLLGECKPKYFLLENVRMKKEYLDLISLFLGVQPICINSSLLSAQNRVRYYWTNIPDIEQPEDLGILLKDIVEGPGQTVGRIVGRRINSITGKRDDYNQNIKTVQRIESRPDNKCGCLSTVQKDNIVVVGIIKNLNKFYLRNEKAMCLDANYYKGADNHGQRTLIVDRLNSSQDGKILSILGKSNTLTAVHNNYPKVGSTKINWRKLTPVECERLQTVPDNYTNHVSNTQRYKMLGNGWTVDVIAHILGGIKCN